MTRAALREAAGAALASVGFLALGAFTAWADGPSLVVWLSLPLGAAGLVAVIVRLLRPPRPSAGGGGSGHPTVALRDGRQYRVDVTETHIVVTHRASGDARRLAWSEITQVLVVAIDAFPVGSMSFMVHAGPAMVEIPTDAEGNGAFLAAMQAKLPGFDNGAMIEATGMLHGFKQLWIRP